MDANRFLNASVIILLSGIGTFISSSRAQETFQLVIPEGTTLCEVGKNGPIEIAHGTLAQIDLLPGTVELRTDVETFETDLIETFNVGAPDRIATATGPGIFTRYANTGGRYDYQFDQRFVLDESVYDLTFSLFDFHSGDPPLVMDGGSHLFSDRAFLYTLWNETWFMEFAPCRLEGQRAAWIVNLEGGRKVEANFRVLQQNACGAWVAVPSARLNLPDLSPSPIEQTDYWNLVTWSVCHFFNPDGMRILFDQPIGEVFGVGLHRDYITGVTAEYLNTALEPIQILNVLSEHYEAVGPLVLNEVMLDNRTTFRDEGGDFDPWIEIYNPQDYFVDLEGVGLTDDVANPNRWIFPAGSSIDPNGFLVVWTDGEPEEGPLHTSFRPASASGVIGLFDRDLYGEYEWDELDYGPQSPDRSMGRLPDGEGGVVDLQFSSPGASNEVQPPSPTPTDSPTPAPTFANERSDIDGNNEVDAMDLLILVADWMKATDAS